MSVDNNFSDLYRLYRGKVISYAVLIVLTIIASLYWQHHKQHSNRVIAQKFQIVLQAMAAADFITAKNYSIELQKYSGSTPYPKLAALILARVFVQEDNLNEAISTLQSIVKKKPKDNIWHIANLRLIKALLLAGKPNEAKNYLEQGMKDQKFSSLYKERQGDILLANQELFKANAFYNQAAKELPEQTYAAWLDLKIADTNVEVVE